MTTPRHVAAWAVAAVASLPLVACGGGGGGGGGAGPGSLGTATHAAAWMEVAGGPGEDYAEVTAAFADGSVVVAGEHAAGAVFGAGQPSETTLPGAGMFVARYAASGDLAWVRALDQGGGIYFTGAIGYPDGSTVVAGVLASAVTFGTGEPGQTTLDPGAGTGFFLARYASDGSLAWARRVTSPTFVWSPSLARLPGGGFVASGSLPASATFGPGEPGETTASVAGAFGEAYLARYEDDGDFVEVRRTGGTAAVGGGAVCALSGGGWAVTGSFAGSATFGAGEPGQTTLATAGGSDVFVAAYAADGSLAWARRAGGTGDDQSDAIAALPDGGAAVAGSFASAATFDGDLADEASLSTSASWALFLARWTPTGGVAWARLAATANDTLRNPGLAAGPGGSLALVTTFWAATTVAPQGPAATFRPGETPDGLFLQWNPDGSLAWARTIGLAGLQQAGQVAFGGDGAFVVLGICTAEAVWDPDGPDETAAAALGGTDAFVLRLAPVP